MRPVRLNSAWRVVLVSTLSMSTLLTGASAQSLAAPPYSLVLAALPPLLGVHDLKFRDIFRLPVGPRGLELAPGVQALAGQRVRLVGYMAQQDGDTGAPGVFILAPLPVVLDSEDESLADDLPPNAVHVHLPVSQQQRSVAHAAGLLAVVGRLEVGAQPEADGRQSMLRLRLDEPAAAPSETTEKSNEVVKVLR